MRSPLDLVAIDPLPTLHQRAAATFSDPRLVQWACRYATYAGSDPWRVPATLGCIPHIEQAYGCWALLGGLATLAEALGRAAATLGVDLHTGAEVVALLTDGPEGRLTGVRLASGEVVAADIVVADVDAAHLYADLLPDRGGRRRVRAAGRSTSGFVLLLGAEGRTEALDHHTVLFSSGYRQEFVDLAAGRPPADPTVYVCAADRTDPSAAPPGPRPRSPQGRRLTARSPGRTATRGPGGRLTRRSGRRRTRTRWGRRVGVRRPGRRTPGGRPS